MPTFDGLKEQIKRYTAQIEGSCGKKILLDMQLPVVDDQCPIIIFSHGFKGFKDWGTFNLIGAACAEEGFCFVKFNFSHNGTTPAHPSEFVDLDAFANNTFTKEMDDLGKIIDFVLKGHHEAEDRIDKEQLCLMGHSRGGGIAILKAAEDRRVKKLITLAAVNDFGRSWKSTLLDKWKKAGVQYVINSRTQQEMPLQYTLYEDYQQHLNRLYIPAAVTQLNIPFLIVHGRKDETICVRAAYEINDWNKDCTELYVVEDANHVFGGQHPWNMPYLPAATKAWLNKALNFLLN